MVASLPAVNTKQLIDLDRNRTIAIQTSRWSTDGEPTRCYLSG